MSNSKKLELRFGEVRELFNEDKNMGERITLEMLAKKYNVSVATLSRVERGEQEPNISVIKAYSETFCVTPGYLLRLDESEKMKETAIIRTLGLTDSATTTLKEILASSSKENDLLAVLNAFLGNGKSTIKFFQDMLHYLKNCDRDVFNVDKDLLGDALFSSMRNYIDNMVKSQLRTVLERTQKMEELSIPNTGKVKYSKIPDNWNQARSPLGMRRGKRP